MNPTIISSLISAAVTLIVCLITNWSSRKKEAVERARRQQKIDDRLEVIEHKLDIHNGYAEKLGDITADIRVMKNDIKHLAEHHPI